MISILVLYYISVIYHQSTQINEKNMCIGINPQNLSISVKSDTFRISCISMRDTFRGGFRVIFHRLVLASFLKKFVNC